MTNIGSTYGFHKNVSFGCKEKDCKCAEAVQSNNYDTQKSEDINLNYGGIYTKALIDETHKNKKMLQDKYKACLVGGAIGDAVGRPIERIRIKEIYERYGENGIQDMQTAGLKGRFTDDTQMTIFTADGLIKSRLSGKGPDEEPDYDIIYQSYKDWYTTQVEGKKDEPNKLNSGWIGELDELYYPGGAGRTCLGSMENGVMGTIENPINDSCGCGAVMRVAPVGLMYHDNPELAFTVGAKCGAMTHGNPKAYLPAGVFACVVANVINGKSIEDAVDASLDILKKQDKSEDVYNLLVKAKELASNDDIKPEQAIDELGKGWNGDEALAISLYCVLKEPKDFKKAVLMAVNHDGDSDSTGAIVGNILGAHLGKGAIPQDWYENVELSSELEDLAQDIINNGKGKRSYSTH